jgi:hypothetical protein
MEPVSKGIANVQRLRKALKYAEKAHDFIRLMLADGAEGDAILDAENKAQQLVSRLQRTLDDISQSVQNRLN